MAQAKLKVILLRATPDPDELVALGARLCYAKADLDALQRQRRCALRAAQRRRNAAGGDDERAGTDALLLAALLQPRSVGNPRNGVADAGTVQTGRACAV